MRIVCKSCGKQFRIDTSKIDTDDAQFQCDQCNNVVKVEMGPTKVAATPYQGIGSESTGVPVAKKPKLGGISIRTKLTVIVVLLVLISLSIVGYLAARQSREALSEQGRLHLKMISNQKAREYDLVFQRIQNEMEAVANYAKYTFARPEALSDLGKPVLLPWNGSGYGGPGVRERWRNQIIRLQRVGKVLESLVALNPYLELGYMGTTDRVMILDSDATIKVIEAVKAYDPVQRPWYKAAVKKKGTIWTDPYIDVNTKKLVVTVATPVYDGGGKLLGVVGLDVLLDTIQKDILNLDIGYKGYALLVDRKGKALVRPGMKEGDTRWDETYKSDNLTKTSNSEFNAIVRKMIQGRSGVDIYQSEADKRYMAYGRVPSVGASVALVVTQGEVIKSALEMQKLITIVWIVVVGIAILIGILIGNGIARPINQLTAMADMISQGEMDLEELPETRNDEIGLLTQAFNRLIISLKVALKRRR